MNHKQVECHFLDGPQRGTIKYLDKEDVLRSRTYIAYDPCKSEPLEEWDANRKTCKIQTYRTIYIYFPIPSSYGIDRFVMLSESGLGV